LLGAEAELRRAPDLIALAVLAVDQARAIINARQVFWVEPDARGALGLRRVSGLVTIDRDAPTVRWLDGTLAAKLTGELRNQIAILSLDVVNSPDDEPYPYPHALWTPIIPRGSNAPIAGLLALREEEWGEGEKALAGRIAETTSHAVLALRATPIKLDRKARRKALAFGVLTLAAAAALIIPVPMTTLAPVEIIGHAPEVVAAPIDGVIERIVVPPNAQVRPGDQLVQYVDTTQRNQLEIAERDFDVAQARLRQVTQSAFLDDKSRREIAQARAEAELKRAERDFARDQFERTRVRAESAGIAIYADPKEWAGRPVQTGQRILDIARAEDVAARVDAPVADAIVVKDGARARLFLDADPLRALDGTVAYASHSARMIEGQGLSYRVDISLAPGGTTPRIGSRGSAQLYGETVPLGFYLFRRPISWLRQRGGL
jgi:multidrug resistance efflux pump